MDKECINEDMKVKFMDKKVMKHFTNGVTHVLILWILSKENIHGYGIMKRIDDFFDCQIKTGLVKKASPSKIYPILQKMEDEGIIIGEWNTNNNKKVKYYEITKRGESLLMHVRSKWAILFKNPCWIEFLSDMSGLNLESINKEVNNEVCNQNQ